MGLLKIILIIIFNLAFLFSNAQNKSFKTSKNTVTKANGVATSVTNTKNMYFEIWLEKVCNGNDCGTINVADGQMHTGKPINYEQFRIYSVKLSDSGVYNYWTIDIGNDGQTILFQVDNNSATPTISMHRYSPGVDGKVLKSTVYYID